MWRLSRSDAVRLLAGRATKGAPCRIRKRTRDTDWGNLTPRALRENRTMRSRGVKSRTWAGAAKVPHPGGSEPVALAVPLLLAFNGRCQYPLMSNESQSQSEHRRAAFGPGRVSLN
jgi:hypothetical protein